MGFQHLTKPKAKDKRNSRGSSKRALIERGGANNEVKSNSDDIQR